MSLEKYLDLKIEKNVPTSFSMPIIPVDEIKDYLLPLSRFKSLKIKPFSIIEFNATIKS
jgi:hypothetical protein